MGTDWLSVADASTGILSRGLVGSGKIQWTAAGMITKAAVDYLKERMNGALQERETLDNLPPEERMRTKVGYTDSASIH